MSAAPQDIEIISFERYNDYHRGLAKVGDDVRMFAFKAPLDATTLDDESRAILAALAARTLLNK